MRIVQTDGATRSSIGGFSREFKLIDNEVKRSSAFLLSSRDLGQSVAQFAYSMLWIFLTASVD
jgi:hypothetical protein